MELNVTGMTCTGCENTVENGLKNMDGVIEVKASHKDNKVILKVEKNKVNRDEISQKIEAVGYKVEE
ncbi:copper chaperone [Ancylomarina longa]|uniref:Copper chaperone n=2 Tax=Ancylomarina longa TaxID=2487017 RepID=A0A434AY59_9BACT|nr:copper chaperone [Ancylomarina longa]